MASRVGSLGVCNGVVPKLMSAYRFRLLEQDHYYIDTAAQL